MGTEQINKSTPILTSSIIDTSDDSSTLECGNQCNINFDNLKWKKTSSTLKGVKISYKNTENQTDLYDYLKLEVPSNNSNIYQLGYIIYRNTKYYLKHIYITGGKYVLELVCLLIMLCNSDFKVFDSFRCRFLRASNFSLLI